MFPSQGQRPDIAHGQTIDWKTHVGGTSRSRRAHQLRPGRGADPRRRAQHPGRRRRPQIVTTILGGGAVALVVVLAVGYWLARTTLRPVEKVTQLAAEIEASDLTRRLAVEGNPAEVQRLANTFDAMLARLEAAFGQQRNFVMDVSHGS